MWVCLATQIMSRTVAASIQRHSALCSLPPEAVYNAKFINCMDELFDIFNSGQQNHFKARKCTISVSNDHINFLNSMEHVA